MDRPGANGKRDWGILYKLLYSVQTPNRNATLPDVLSLKVVSTRKLSTRIKNKTSMVSTLRSAKAQ